MDVWCGDRCVCVSVAICWYRSVMRVFISGHDLCVGATWPPCYSIGSLIAGNVGRMSKLCTCECKELNCKDMTIFGFRND